jgi:hypothetical protein
MKEGLLEMTAFGDINYEEEEKEKERQRQTEEEAERNENENEKKLTDKQQAILAFERKKRKVLLEQWQRVASQVSLFLSYPSLIPSLPSVGLSVFAFGSFLLLISSRLLLFLFLFSFSCFLFSGRTTRSVPR